MRLDRRYLAVGPVVALVAGAALGRLRRDEGSPPAENALVTADWCAPGLEPIEGGGCFAGSANAQGLVVYLHGRYTPETQNEEIDRQARVARIAASRGFSVLAFRGRQGACIGPELASYWCWPSNERTQDAGPDTVASWDSALRAVEGRIGKSAHYLLGFSNGGYFASLIATRSLLALDAIAIVGAGPVEPTRAVGPKPPMLLITADEDGALDEMLRLDSELDRESWPHVLTSREGGHALTDFDVDTALDFFARTKKEKLPKLTSRRPIRKLDAAVDDAQLEPATPPASASAAGTGAPDPENP